MKAADRKNMSSVRVKMTNSEAITKRKTRSWRMRCAGVGGLPPSATLAFTPSDISAALVDMTVL